MRSLILILGVCLPLTGALWPGRAATTLTGNTVGDGATVSISSPFPTLPPGGCAPFRVNIRNDRSTPGTWRIAFVSYPTSLNAGTTVYAQELTVAGNTTGQFDLLVPVPILFSQNDTGLNVGVTGPGFSSTGTNTRFAYFYLSNSNAGTPFTLLGKDLLGSIGTGPLESLCTDKGATFYGGQVDVSTLPTDWRAYSGVASMMLKDTEWLEMDSVRRDAIGDYVAQGGRLTIFTTEPVELRAPQLQLPTPSGKPGPYGFGGIKMKTVLALPPNADALYTTMVSNHAPAASEVDQNFSTWEMRVWAGVITVSVVFILAFILIFGSLVGPLNLFVFARGSRRFRLFWTTPLISIGASIVLVLGILFTDGIGGRGKQMVAFFSLPGANRQAIIQEQVARTAVLFTNRWSNTQDYLITPVSVQSMSGSMEHADGYNYQNALNDRNGSSENYHQNGNVLSGNWFRSRAVTGQYLQAMSPSRSVLTVLNPAAPNAGQDAPELLSSFPDVLSVVYVVDLQGQHWTCRDLAPGQKKTCAASTQSDYDKFWRALYSKAGGKLRPALQTAADRPGCFYATGPTSPGETLATLSEIHWEVASGVYLGTWVASTTPENTP